MKRILLPALLFATPAWAQVTNDPEGSSPILAALQWVQGTLLGNLATTAAVIAVAVVGFMMLTGRIEWRRGLTVVIGCFIIFGAVAIVAGIRTLGGRLALRSWRGSHPIRSSARSPGRKWWAGSPMATRFSISS